MKKAIPYLCYLAIPLFLMAKCGSNHAPIPINVPVSGGGNDQTEDVHNGKDDGGKHNEHSTMQEALCYIKVLVTDAKDGSRVKMRISPASIKPRT
jgi:hypothetical protein